MPAVPQVPEAQAVWILRWIVRKQHQARHRLIVVRFWLLLALWAWLIVFFFPVHSNAQSANVQMLSDSRVTTTTNTLLPTPATSTPTATPECTPIWSIVTSPNPSTYSNELSGVAAISSNDVWVVGAYQYAVGTTALTLALHWDGQQWTQVPSPNRGTEINSLIGVGAVSSNDVWAVGYSRNRGGAWSTLTEHWDGTQWSVIPSLNPRPVENYLYEVSALSSNDVWAVGYWVANIGGYGIDQTLVEHWDGNQWSIVPSPNVGTANNGLYAVSALSPSDVWAVGSYGNNLTLVEHWNGTQWSIVPNPDPGGSYDNSLYGVSALAADNVWIVGSYQDHTGASGTLVEHWNGAQLSIIPSPNVGSGFNKLMSISALSPTDVWAAGYYCCGDNGLTTLIEHWDGAQWSIVPSPNATLHSNYLFGIAAASANDVWAVGYYETCLGCPELTLVEHYALPDGCTPPSPTPTAPPTLTPTVTTTPSATPECTPTWGIVTSPNPSSYSNYLFGVAATSADDVWAVGAYQYAVGTRGLTLALHWDGNQWTHVFNPNTGTGSNYLLGVGAVSSNDVWAVGFYNGGDQTLTEHWDGSQWRIVPSPNAGQIGNKLEAVKAVSSDDVWAVGYYVANVGGYGYSRTLVEHWDGSQWSIIPSPNLNTNNNELWGVSAFSATDVWAVGHYMVSSGSLYTLVEHWDGQQWSIVSSPDPGGSYNNFLYGISALAADNVWIVGSYQDHTGASGTLVEHWNGAQLSIIPSPNVGSGFNKLMSISALSPTDVWAAGYYCCGDNGLTTLIEHWDGQQWSIVSSPDASTNDNYLLGVVAVSAHDVWAVGFYDTCFGCPELTLVEHYALPDGCTPPSPTPTAPPTLTPTVTTTPTAPHVLVSHVDWEVRPLQPDQLQMLPITLTLASGTTEVDYPAQPTDQYGFFTVTLGSLHGGTYSWRADDVASEQHSPNYLANSGTVNLTGEPVTNLEMGMMRAGDADNNNRVNISDFNMLKVSFGSTCGSPTYDMRTDFTGDCFVNIADFVPLKRNFGQQGAQPIGP